MPPPSEFGFTWGPKRTPRPPGPSHEDEIPPRPATVAEAFAKPKRKPKRKSKAIHTSESESPEEVEHSLVPGWKKRFIRDGGYVERLGRRSRFFAQGRVPPRTEVILNTINITSTVSQNSIIEVQAFPESNDVVGLKDLYLSFDVSNSTINTVKDVIASGEDVSGVVFTRDYYTSSYSNGDLERK